jgi:hypothetical protein
VWLALVCASGLCFSVSAAKAQNEPGQSDLGQRVKLLTDVLSRVEAQLDESQRQLAEMRAELTRLRQQLPPSGEAADPHEDDSAAAKLAAQVRDLRESQSMQEAQIAAQEQTKVESESKYPVKISGLILMNGFVNTGNVDMPATPTIAIPGEGSTGASVRQSMLGVDMRGPHVFGARSHGDLRVDFDGSVPAASGYTGGYGVTLARLRTVHAALDWDHTQAFFSLDRTIVNPDAPDSLTAIAEPPLAWSGNLWTWNPQVGITRDVSLGSAQRLRMQASLIDVFDPPTTASLASSNTATSERSRWPGIEARIAMPGGQFESGLQVGVGGLFAPHSTVGGTNFDSWAGTLDFRLALPARMDLRGSFYRGQALGGFGGGAFKDYVYRVEEDETYFRALDDIGGWIQWKQKPNEKLEFNEAFGIDNVPANQLRPFAEPAYAVYQNLARNRTFTANVIFSPSAYVLFSLEYRRVESSPVNSPTNASDIIGLAAGYRF